MFKVPAAAPAVLLDLVPGYCPQQAALRVRHVGDLGEHGHLLQAHVSGRHPTQRRVVELLRPAEPD
ncbi:hypothetical protein [Streptomyces cyslabdanicus]|uniref:hypothetical protein n=1 Tax=Streptomyces cyslabdanicus TaxID=1470456 RepID=UPI004043CC70